MLRIFVRERGGGIVSDDGGWTKEKIDGADNGIEILDMYSAGVLSDILYTPERTILDGISYDSLDAISGYDFVVDNRVVCLENLYEFYTNDPNFKLGYVQNLGYHPEGMSTGLSVYCTPVGQPVGGSGVYQHNGVNSYIRMRWRNVVSDSFGKKYDLEMLVSNIRWHKVDATTTHEVLCDFVYDNGFTALCFRAMGWWPAMNAWYGAGTMMDVMCTVVDGNTGNAVDGNLLYGILDLDVHGINGYSGFMSDFCESIQLNSGYSNIHVQSDTVLHVKENQKQFIAGAMTDNNVPDILRSGVSFIGCGDGISFTWAGLSCGTAAMLDLQSVLG